MISIIVTAYNYSEFIRECIDSILNQKSSHTIEIIVVNDCSVDNTEKILLEYEDRIRYIKTHKNVGPAIARNIGLLQARGEYLCCFDGDDIMNSGFIEKHIEALIKNNVDFVFSGLEHIGEETGEFMFNDFNPVLCARNPFCPVCCVFKKSIYDKMGGFDEEAIIEDWFFWMEAVDNMFVGFNINEPLFKYRKHKGSRNYLIRQMNNDGIKQIQDKFKDAFIGDKFIKHI